jgi:hypothetical protein
MGPAVRWAVVLLAALRPGEASTPEPDLLWQPQIGPRLVNVLQQLQSEERSVTNLPFFNGRKKEKRKKIEPQNYLFNPFLFIRGLSCPSCIQALLSLNFLKLTVPGFPHNCLSVSCSDIGFKKTKTKTRSSIGLEISLQSAFSAFLGHSHPLQTILLGDL